MKRLYFSMLLSFLHLAIFSQDIEWGGFFELRGGTKIDADIGNENETISEGRFQIRATKPFDHIEFNMKAELVTDAVAKSQKIDLHQNSGWAQLREANANFFPFEFMEFKVGRQILTWGTGEFLFINDLFPKNWKSFFIGRNNEYLKSPSDAVKLSLFHEKINLDLIYIPLFDPDTHINGERLSYYEPANNLLTQTYFSNDEKNRWFREDEISARIYGRVNGYEWAFYTYDGFWKTPTSFDPIKNEAYHARLQESGFSLRGNLFKGIFNLEAGYFYSQDDVKGENPLIPNSQLRALLGYEQEIIKNFTMGAQYYIEYMQNYSEFNKNNNSPSHQNEFRHVTTLKIIWLLMNQNLTINLFGFYSPNEKDAYLKPNIAYSFNDHWKADIGANLFFGEKSSFFGQFKENQNIYAGLRYSF